jgi:hypothetical protein
VFDDSVRPWFNSFMDMYRIYFRSKPGPALAVHHSSVLKESLVKKRHTRRFVLAGSSKFFERLRAGGSDNKIHRPNLLGR